MHKLLFLLLIAPIVNAEIELHATFGSVPHASGYELYEVTSGSPALVVSGIESPLIFSKPDDYNFGAFVIRAVNDSGASPYSPVSNYQDNQNPTYDIQLPPETPVIINIVRGS